MVRKIPQGTHLVHPLMVCEAPKMISQGPDPDTQSIREGSNPSHDNLKIFNQKL